MRSDIDIKPMKPCHIDRTRSLRNQAMSLSKGKPLPYPSPRRPGGGSGVGSREGVRGLFGSKAALQPAKSRSGVLSSANKDLQERSKMFSKGFWRLHVLGTSSETPFGIDFCFQEDAAAPQKCKNFVRRPSDFEVVRFSFRVAIRVRFWTLPGSIMRTIWPL